MTREDKLASICDQARREVLQSVRELKATGQGIRAVKLVRTVFGFSFDDALKFYEVA